MYHIGEQQLPSLDVIRDLGIMIDKDLKFSAQVASAVSRCSRTMSWILRAFVISDTVTHLRLLDTYVAPLLLYTSVAWSPNKESDIKLLEKLQRSFLCRVEFRCNHNADH